MKLLINIFFVILFLVSCKEKDTTPVSMPDASFTFKVENNNVSTFYFSLNRGDVARLDFGDGSIFADSLVATSTEIKKTVQISHKYKVNGNFTVTLSIKNKRGIDIKQKNIEANKIPISDFSYEILDNGKVKFKNLSQNALEYKWSIVHYNTGNGYPFHVSTEKDIEVTIDLVGKYFVALEANRGEYTSNKLTKLINIKSAKYQTEFFGLYNGKKINGSLEREQLYYFCGFGSSFELSQTYYVLAQSLFRGSYENDSLKITESGRLFTKFHPLIPYKQGYIPTQQERYLALKKYLTKENDSNIIEVLEEDLDPKFYNNDRYYPKAFWLKYKIKNDILDGVMKVRIVVEGLK